MKHVYSILFLLIFLFVFSTFALANISVTLLGVTPKDDYFEVTTKVSGMSSSSGTFVQGMFTSKDASRYFGYTWGQKSDWVLYDGSPEKSFVLQNFVELKNDQETKVLLKPDFTDPDYKGPGEYTIKLKRYTSSGGSGEYSENSLTVNLSFSAPTSNPTTSSTPTPTSVPSTPTIIKNNTTPTSLTKTSSPSVLKVTVMQTPKDDQPILFVPSQTPTVLAVSTDSATQISEVSNPAPIRDKNIFFLGTAIFVISGAVLYFRLKSL